MTKSLSNLSVWFITITFVLVGAISTLCVVYWFKKACSNSNSSNQTNLYSKLLMRTSWVGIIVFWVVSITFAVHSIVSLMATDGNYLHFTKRYKIPAPNFEIFVISGVYGLNKYVLYFTLYLRLKILLQGTMFEYSNKTYNCLKLMLILSVIIILISLCMVFWYYNVALFFAIFYIILDIIIPIYINYLFIKKLQKIRKFSTNLQRNKMANNTHLRQHQQQSLQIYLQHQKSETSKSAKRADLTVVVAKQIHVHNQSQSKQPKSTNSDQIFTIMKRSTISATIIALSSLLVLLFILIRSSIVFIFNNGNEILIVLVLQFLGFTIDSLINLVCMISHFEFTQQFRNIISNYVCFCCDKCGLSDCLSSQVIGINVDHDNKN